MKLINKFFRWIFKKCPLNDITKRIFKYIFKYIINMDIFNRTIIDGRPS